MNNKKRLLKLADLLEADAKRKTGVKFDMRDWGTVTSAENPVSCGTTACAIGLAALSGAFERAGLRAEIEDTRLIFNWHGRRADGYEVASELFNINSSDASHLFASYSYGENKTGARTELRVAKRIRQFCS